MVHCVCVCVVHRDVTGAICVTSVLLTYGFASTTVAFSLAVAKHCLITVTFIPKYSDILLLALFDSKIVNVTKLQKYCCRRRQVLNNDLNVSKSAMLVNM